jgi:hypothetical protein
MTKEQLIEKYGKTKTKFVAGILHNYLYGNTMQDHHILENKIRVHGDLLLKDSIVYLEDILEFE